MIRLKSVVGTYTTVRGTIDALDDVTAEFDPGNIIGIAGESGCGKSTLLKLLYGNIEYPLSMSKGLIDYGMQDEKGRDITTDNISEHWFKRISYIPQSSMSSLNPVIKIRKQFLDFQDFKSRREVDDTVERIVAFLRQLDLNPEVLDAYPHQLSGGMRQRVMVALGAFFQPDIILADEPTTALDVVVQKGILLLLAELQEKMNNTMFLVTHDMGVHYQLTHKMVIMYAAKIVEMGDSEAIFARPRHPYTKMLIESLPRIGDAKRLQGVEGKPPSLWDRLDGCRFAPRCSRARKECREICPEMRETERGHAVACLYPES
jgi:peptide/nickel transport system ATP-binding protein